jgi:hypothetical protein
VRQQYAAQYRAGWFPLQVIQACPIVDYFLSNKKSPVEPGF